MNLFHIYYGTAGNAGLYLDEIHTALKDICDQKLFVNYYYPFNEENTHKCFFKFTEKHENNNFDLLNKSKIRLFIRGIELFFGYIYVLFYILYKKPEIINFSLINTFGATFFLKSINLLSPKTKIIITCHDVIPYENSYNNKNLAERKIIFKRIFDLGDFLLVHNNFSKKTLKNDYNVNDKKIFEHKFPIMDLSKLTNKDELKNTNDHSKKFLFIGYLRKEKGIDILLDAWEKVEDQKNINLTIAGFKPNNENYNFDQIRNFKNFTLKLYRLSDEEYINEINNSDFVIFPYKKVSNSGVLSTVVSLGRIPVVSDLEPFTTNEFVDEQFVFRSNSSEDLAKTINKIKLLSFDEIDKYKKRLKNKFDKKNDSNKINIKETYLKIFSCI